MALSELEHWTQIINTHVQFWSLKNKKLTSYENDDWRNKNKYNHSSARAIIIIKKINTTTAMTKTTVSATTARTRIATT